MEYLDKLIRIFSSCETENHVDVAIAYANLLLKRLPKGGEHVVDNIMAVRSVERIIGHAQGRLDVKF